MFLLAKSDQSLFTRCTSSSSLFVLVYVDDILVTGSSDVEVANLIVKLNKIFALKDLGEVNYFLGIQVKHTEEGIHLS